MKCAATAAAATAVAVFRDGPIQGEVVGTHEQGGLRLTAVFRELPPGRHGFHIHKAGDLRGEGCLGACDHFHIGAPCRHGDRPHGTGDHQERHTGDLGNISSTHSHYSYFLKGVRVEDLWGRSLIVHKDEDDLGKGDFPDSGTTGHSGARIGCAVIGRGTVSQKTRRRTRRRS
jgi:Cu-Zn family superoxide dismutase